MNAFNFRLQRVLDFRRTQFQLAEVDYQRAAAALRSIQAQHVALASRKSETRKSVVRLPEAMGRDLAPLPGWYGWVASESDRLRVLERSATQEVNKRRAALIEAQRKVKLLEKLHDRRKGEWQSAFDRELEELAADSVNSRYVQNLG